jgi:hypothetical protein
MYWYKLRSSTFKSFIAILMLVIGVSSCKNDSNSTSDTAKFFDIKGYFRADSARLSKLNPLITKTVTHNNDAETKKVRISNWGTELSLFAESDINKPAWRDSYEVQSSENIIIYLAKDSSLRTRRIIINKIGNRVRWILIFNYAKSALYGKNMLYESAEKLSYFPDSLYLIQKKQRVKLLGINRYTISGAFH